MEKMMGKYMKICEMIGKRWKNDGKIYENM
jgi:hypothetical protein